MKFVLWYALQCLLTYFFRLHRWGRR